MTDALRLLSPPADQSTGVYSLSPGAHASAIPLGESLEFAKHFSDPLATDPGAFKNLRYLLTGETACRTGHVAVGRHHRARCEVAQIVCSPVVSTRERDGDDGRGTTSRLAGGLLVIATICLLLLQGCNSSSDGCAFDLSAAQTPPLRKGGCGRTSAQLAWSVFARFIHLTHLRLGLLGLPCLGSVAEQVARSEDLRGCRVRSRPGPNICLASS